LHHKVRDDLATEAPAKKCDVHRHVGGDASDRFRNRLLASRNRLDRSPDLDRAILIAGRRVDGLVRSVRDVRQLESPLDDRRRAILQHFSRMAPHERGDAMLGI
jgi:hypothetical protein